MSIWEELTGYLSFSFVQYALIASVLIALCSSLLGVTLVLKRFSVIGDGLSHVAFGALAIATVLRLSNSMLLVMPALYRKDQRRCRHCHAVRERSCAGLSGAELVFLFRQYLGRCLQYIVRLYADSDPFHNRCVGLRGNVHCGHGNFPAVLS